MGAHALGASVYAAKAARLAASDQPVAVSAEVTWQLENMRAQVRATRKQLPPLGEDSAGPLGPELLAPGILGSISRRIQFSLRDTV